MENTLTGLEPGERVIVDGVQRVRADALVNPTEVSPAAPAPLDGGARTAQAGRTIQPEDHTP